ncbi:MAG: hypothetical protein AB8B72_05825 [Crocinitomicaceae bacterium]
MKHIIVFLFLGVLLISCNPEKKYAAEIQEIEKYETSLDSLVSVYNSIKFDSLTYIQSTASQAEKMIKMHYTADTISMDLGERLRFIKSVRKSLGSIDVKKKSLKRELRMLKEQFATLKIDVQEGLYGRSQIDEYLLAEKKAYENLTENLNTVLDNQKKQLHDFNYAYPTVREYIELINPTDNQD